MNINNEYFEITKTNAYYGYSIEIISKDKKFILNFNNEELILDKMELNKTIDLKKYIYFDAYFLDGKMNYCFDIADNKVDLTKIGDNLYKLDVDVKDIDEIVSYDTDYKLKTIKINTDISFEFDYEIEIRPEIKEAISKPVQKTPDNFFEVIGK